MLPLKAFVLVGVFWLFFRLRHTQYSAKSALLVSMVWATIVLIVTLIMKGFTGPALGVAGVQVIIATTIFYAVAFLDNTAFALGAWPLGFLAVLLFG